MPRAPSPGRAGPVDARGRVGGKLDPVRRVTLGKGEGRLQRGMRMSLLGRVADSMSDRVTSRRMGARESVLMGIALAVTVWSAGSATAAKPKMNPKLIPVGRVRTVFESRTLRAFPVPLVASLPEMVGAYGLGDRKTGNNAVGIVTVYASIAVAKTVQPASAVVPVYRVRNVVLSMGDPSDGVSKEDERAALSSLGELGSLTVVAPALPP